jgi:hypothetical protein
VVRWTRTHRVGKADAERALPMVLSVDGNVLVCLK